MRKTHDILAKTGTYKNQQGEQKNRYTKCGAAFTDDSGQISIKLESVPVSPEWNGWLNLWEPREQQQAPAQAPAPQPRQAAPAISEQDDIPF